MFSIIFSISFWYSIVPTPFRGLKKSDKNFTFLSLYDHRRLLLKIIHYYIYNQ